jgi:hypothetical protein
MNVVIDTIVTPVDKIDAEELIKDFRVQNAENFSLYLKEIWKVNLKPN